MEVVGERWADVARIMRENGVVRSEGADERDAHEVPLLVRRPRPMSRCIHCFLRRHKRIRGIAGAAKNRFNRLTLRRTRAPVPGIVGAAATADTSVAGGSAPRVSASRGARRLSHDDVDAGVQDGAAAPTQRRKRLDSWGAVSVASSAAAEHGSSGGSLERGNSSVSLPHGSSGGSLKRGLYDDQTHAADDRDAGALSEVQARPRLHLRQSRDYSGGARLADGQTATAQHAHAFDHHHPEARPPRDSGIGSAGRRVPKGGGRQRGETWPLSDRREEGDHGDDDGNGLAAVGYDEDGVDDYVDMQQQQQQFRHTPSSATRVAIEPQQRLPAAGGTSLTHALSRARAAPSDRSPGPTTASGNSATPLRSRSHSFLGVNGASASRTGTPAQRLLSPWSSRRLLDGRSRGVSGGYDDAGDVAEVRDDSDGSSDSEDDDDEARGAGGAVPWWTLVQKTAVAGGSDGPPPGASSRRFAAALMAVDADDSELAVATEGDAAAAGLSGANGLAPTRVAPSGEMLGALGTSSSTWAADGRRARRASSSAAYGVAVGVEGISISGSGSCGVGDGNGEAGASPDVTDDAAAADGIHEQHQLSRNTTMPPRPSVRATAFPHAGAAQTSLPPPDSKRRRGVSLDDGSVISLPPPYKGSSAHDAPNLRLALSEGRDAGRDVGRGVEAGVGPDPSYSATASATRDSSPQQLGSSVPTPLLKGVAACSLAHNGDDTDGTTPCTLDAPHLQPEYADAELSPQTPGGGAAGDAPASGWASAHLHSVSRRGSHGVGTALGLLSSAGSDALSTAAEVEVQPRLHYAAVTESDANLLLLAAAAAR